MQPSPSILAALMLAAVASTHCGGGSSSTAPSPTPTGSTPVTVSIVATNGNKSYVPNPVPVSAQQVRFTNNDGTSHHIVMDDGSADFGTLAPGVTSAARGVGSGPFHCTIHPSMVGSINGAAAPEPPVGSGDGY